MIDKNEEGWVYASRGHKSEIVHGKWGDILAQQWSSRSPAYLTKEELIEKQGILPEPCKECGSPISTTYLNKADLIEHNLCFTCDHWRQKLAIKDNPRTARIDGGHYYIEDDKPNAVFQGFGGQKFVIRFHDGREVVTHNLWFQGEIPEWYKERLPDNAQFIKQNKY